MPSLWLEPNFDRLLDDLTVRVAERMNNYSKAVQKYGEALSGGNWNFGEQSKRRVLLPNRRCKAKQHVAAIEARNTRLALIYRLPKELHLQILKGMPRADVLSLRLANRYFASLVQRVVEKRIHPNLDTMEDLRERLERDRYARLASAEPIDTKYLSRLLCSKCRKAHMRNMFDQKEKAKSAHDRQCLGHTATFRACRHRISTHYEVKTHSARICDIAVPLHPICHHA
jgi:hypothetical protein